ncbi:MAG: VOC family protein, partial [Terracidiphilus sp.]
MKSAHRCLIISAMFLLSLVSQQNHAQSAKREPPESSTRPVLVTTCVISADVKRLVGFYETILQQKATWSGDDYAEFQSSAGVLAVFSASAQEKYIPGSAEAAKNRSVVLEFKVADADAEYQRLQGIVKVWVKPPTTQPWGTRSIYFRDPDGNLVDFSSLPQTKISKR